MTEVLNNYIITHGYLAIFCMVLIQELGIPGLPNEMVLFYFGFLSHQAHLSFPLIITLVVIADVLGSFLLYTLFYFGRGWLLLVKPNWIRLPVEKVNSLKDRIANYQAKTIFLGKLTPFIRGYIPVAAGMLQVNPMVYGKNIILTAIIWSGGWITIGWFFYSLH